jgi:hypothetical protein
MVEEVIRHYKTSCNIKKELVLIKAPALFVKRRFLSAIIEKRLFLTGRTGQHHPRRQAQSSVRLSAHEATAHNLTSVHGRARLNLPPAPDVAQLPDCRPTGQND